MADETVQPAPPEDYQEYKVFRETGKLPDNKAQESSEGSVEPAKDAQPETVSDSETDEEIQEPERDDKGRYAKRGLDKRFHVLTSKIRDLERQLATREQPGVASPKQVEPETEPKPENFAEYPDYVRALTKYTATQVAHEQHAAAIQADKQQSANQAWIDREKSVRAANEDYDEVISSVDDIQFHPDLLIGLKTSAMGPQIAYHLAHDRDECLRIARLDPIAAVREIGKLEAKLTQATPEKSKTPKLSQAPEPIKPRTGSGNAASTKKPEEMDYREYRLYRESQPGYRR